MALNLNRQSGNWNPTNRRGLNENWDILEGSFSEYDKKIQQAYDKAQSAYELWLEAGNTGTLQDFFNSLKGESPTAQEVAPLLQPYVDTQVSEKFSQLSAEQQSSAEIVEARDGEATLLQKINLIEDEAAKAKEQTDFVKKLSDLVHYDEIQVKKSTATTLTVTNFNKTTQRHVSNIFSKNTNDDYWILSESYIGGTSFSELAKEQKSYTKVSGTIDTTYATHWASLGAKIKVEITGSEIYFRRFGDNRGGIWRFVLDGDTNNPKDVSVYKATSGTDEIKIFSGLEDKLHLIEAEFIGDDPNNPPSGGAGTSRGWLTYSATDTANMTFKSYYNNLNITREKTINTPLSNKDFAYLIRELNTTQDFHFIPEHNATGTAFKFQEPQLLLDGKALDFANMPLGINHTGKNFMFVQGVNGVHPTTQKALLKIQTIHEINLKSIVRILGKTTALADVEFKDAYHGMLPVHNDAARRLISGLYNEYPTLVNDGSRTNLIEEEDTTSSYIFTSDLNVDLFSALRINDVSKTLRSGLTGKFPVDQRTWIEHRASSTMQKLYNSIFRYGSLLQGESLTFDLSYLSGEIPKVHNIL